MTQRIIYPLNAWDSIPTDWSAEELACTSDLIDSLMSGGFTLYASNPICDGVVGSNPVCINDGEGNWHLWRLCAFDGVWGLSHAHQSYYTSTDGVNFTLVSTDVPGLPSLQVAFAGSVEEFTYGQVVSVMKDGATWKMWYRSSASTISYATASNPAGPWTLFNNGAAVFSVPSQAWETYPRVMAFKVIKEGDVYKAWYTGYAPATIGAASSPTGYSEWVKYAGNPVIAGDGTGMDAMFCEWQTPFRVGNKHVIVYEAAPYYPWTTYRFYIFAAWSSDGGYTWTRTANPIITWGGQSWCDFLVGHPNISFDFAQNKWVIHFFAIGNAVRIGVATCNIAVPLADMVEHATIDIDTTGHGMSFKSLENIGTWGVDIDLTDLFNPDITPDGDNVNFEMSAQPTPPAWNAVNWEMGSGLMFPQFSFKTDYILEAFENVIGLDLTAIDLASLLITPYFYEPPDGDNVNFYPKDYSPVAWNAVNWIWPVHQVLDMSAVSLDELLNEIGLVTDQNISVSVVELDSALLDPLVVIHVAPELGVLGMDMALADLGLVTDVNLSVSVVGLEIDLNDLAGLIAQGIYRGTKVNRASGAYGLGEMRQSYTLGRADQSRELSRGQGQEAYSLGEVKRGT